MIIIANLLPTRLRAFHSTGPPRCPAGLVDALASRLVSSRMNHPKWPFIHRTLQLAAIKDGMASRREPLQRFHGASSHDGPKQAQVNFSGLRRRHHWEDRGRVRNTLVKPYFTPENFLFLVCYLICC